MQFFVPVVPSGNEFFRYVVVAGVQQLQHFPQQLADNLVIAIVVYRQKCRLAAQFDQAVLDKEVELHQLHILVRLLGSRLHDLQGAANAVGVVSAHRIGIVIACVPECRRGEQRYEVGFHLFEQIGKIGQRSVETTAIGSDADTEIMADLVPQRSVETAVQRQVIAKGRIHNGVIAPLAIREYGRIGQYVIAYEYGSAVLACMVRVIG